MLGAIIKLFFVMLSAAQNLSFEADEMLHSVMLRSERHQYLWSCDCNFAQKPAFQPYNLG